MTIYFIGAGPGAADLITLRGQTLISQSPVCLYAGALVPEEILSHSPAECEIINTANLSLEEILEHMVQANKKGLDVARLHSGDTSLYSAIGEQIAALKQQNISYQIIPGVPAFCAAAAALGVELTLPGIAQSIVLTRSSKNSSAMPDGETLENFAKTGSTLVLHLSAKMIGSVCQRAAKFYGEECPAAIIYRASWPDEQIITASLKTLAEQSQRANIQKTATIIIGPVLAGIVDQTSSLYSPHRAHQRKVQAND